jgi:predicted dehydrogenase
MIRIGILGCGRIARTYHLEILARVPDVEIAALAEPDEAARRAAAAVSPGAATHGDWRRVTESGAIDAVVICLPSHLHSVAARTAFEAGKHVYLEKPIAIDADDAAAVVAAWRSSGKTGMTGFNQRFHPVVGRAREAIRGGVIGTIVGARMASGSPPRELPAWKRSRATGGGALLDALSHHADLARFLFDDEVRDVSASVRSLRSEFDNAWTTLTMIGGVRVESRVSFTSPQENRFEVTGEEGTLRIDRIEGSLTLDAGGARWSRRARIAREIARLRHLSAGLRSALASRRDPSYRLALSALVRAVREGSHPKPDIEDGERSLAVVLAAEAAAREGRRVAVAPAPAR